MNKLDNVIFFDKEEILKEFDKFFKDFAFDRLNEDDVSESVETIYNFYFDYKNNYEKLVEFMDENRYFVNLCAIKKIKMPQAILLDLGDMSYLNTFANDDEECLQEWSDFSKMAKTRIQLRNKK